MTASDEISRYAAGVRHALADLADDEREALLEELEDHLAEVAAESGAPLSNRLGNPEEYASQLRAAYGARMRRRQPRRRTRVLAAVLVLLVAAGAWVVWRSTQEGVPLNVHWGFLLAMAIWLVVVVSIVAAGVRILRRILGGRRPEGSMVDYPAA